MNIRILLIMILTALFMLATGVTAQNLLSLDYSFTDGWNNGNIALPAPGTLTIPKGPGILTITTIREPYRSTGTSEGPDQVTYVNYGNPAAGTDLGLPLGDTYYQREAEIKSMAGVSDGLPLTTISRYYSDLESEKTLVVRILPVFTRNTYHQLPEKIQYTASWEPLEQGRATMNDCDVTGTWKSNLGDMTIAYAPSIDNKISLSGVFTNQQNGTFDGIFSGPAFTGRWSEPDSPSGDDTGRFTLLFKDSCCSFTGTRGSGESDTSLGEWTGIRG